MENVGSLSNEIVEKLIKINPPTLGAASRISGVTPAAIIAIMRYLKKQKNNFLELPEVKSDQFLTRFVLESGFLYFLLNNKVCQPCQEHVRPLRYPTEG